MPAYHSAFNELDIQQACSCSLLPLKTSIRGPAPAAPAEEDDVIDETLNYFRANVLFRNFHVDGGADRTLIYLTLFTAMCLKEMERVDKKDQAIRDLRNIAIRQFSIPGDAGWPLGGLFPAPARREEGDAFKAYFKQAREELAQRLVERLFNADGTKNKWWQAFSKRKFMGKELQN